VIVAMMTMKPSFTEALHALESGRAFMYAHVNCSRPFFRWTFVTEDALTSSEL
jgi:hypothetical protein